MRGNSGKRDGAKILGLYMQYLRTFSQSLLPPENASNHEREAISRDSRTLNLHFRSGLGGGLSASEVSEAYQVLKISLGSSKI